VTEEEHIQKIMAETGLSRQEVEACIQLMFDEMTKWLKGKLLDLLGHFHEGGFHEGGRITDDIVPTILTNEYVVPKKTLRW
jgi:hypothetical protein